MTNKEAIEILTNVKNTPQITWANGADVAFDIAIKALQERPQGEWIDTGSKEEYWDEEYQCSICGGKDHWHNFCPNCGADMTKEEEK